jgi:hypothetical protein
MFLLCGLCEFLYDSRFLTSLFPPEVLSALRKMASERAPKRLWAA